MFQQNMFTDDSIYYDISVNGYVVSRVASQDGFSRISELRFQKVMITISLRNCWTWASFVCLDFLFVLHNSTPSTHLMAVFTIYHTGE